ALFLKHGPQRLKPVRRTRQMVQDSGAVDVIELTDRKGLQIQDRLVQPGDIGELPCLGPAFGDRHASGAKIQMHDFSVAIIAQLLGQEDRLVAGATPSDQGSEWTRKILFALEAVEVDDLEKIVPAVLQ